MTIDIAGRVAIVTGAGAGLGRAHALALASRGARVVVNDLNADAAYALSATIIAQGGEALADSANVTDFEAVQVMTGIAMDRWGKIDILVNNAGVLRDRSFSKMDLDDFRLLIDVHLMGAVNCTKAVWEVMRRQHYGRVVFTTSSSGLYGNFGQSNYAAVKMALVGLMQTLSLEGERYDIRVNCLAPSASTAMTEGLYGKEALASLGPELVTPALLALVAEGAPTRTILLAGAGSFEQAHITMTKGIYLGSGFAVAEQLLKRMNEVADREAEMVPSTGSKQYQYELERAIFARESTTDE